MSNKEILQQHNVRLNDNNTDLTSILEIINNLPDKVYIKLQEKNVEPTTEQQEIVPDEGYTGLEKVTVAAIEENNLEIIPSSENQNFEGIYTKVSVPGEENLVPDNIKKGTSIFGVEGNASVADFKITSGYSLFYGGNRTDYLQEILSLCDKITSAYSMFSNCKDLTEIDVSNLDTSEVTTMSNMFSTCNNLTELDVSNFDTSKVTSMTRMFYFCESLTELNVSDWNTGNVTDMNNMFYQCSSLTELDLSNFDTSEVTDMNNMFYSIGRDTKLNTLDISNFDMSKVINVRNMLGSLLYLKNLNFGTNLGKGYKQQTNNYSNYVVEIKVSSNLTRDSLMSIINNIYDLNLTYDVANGGTLYTQTLALGSTNKNKLTPEDIAVATNKRLDGKLIIFKLERRNKMIFFNYTAPRMIVAEQGKHIRAINDVYVPAHYDEEGNLVEEHFPHYSTTIFVPDIYQTMEDIEKDYVEENIENIIKGTDI